MTHTHTKLMKGTEVLTLTDLPTYKITFAGQNVKFCRILQIFAGHPHPHYSNNESALNQFESVMIAIAS